ncbi:peptidylprolyl isomerase [Afipia birgiae]|jgi:peptidyl-prolyl cis-trans isomerase D|uniref:peptidylprolyl isomerase n=1 Tax=Afipia birgiae TaxID=151414 RepID=UPI0002D7E3D2|nr:peptidylprolyl isomerase [Afipia birgiae]MBX9819969.1 peptidylprolyl isomerase [Afipia birgiae]
MRKASSNWLGKTVMSVLFGVLIISFGVWGIADIFKGFGQSSLAKVGNTEITTEQFRNLFTDRVQQIGRRFGRPLTMEQARQFGLDRQVLQDVIADAALDETARRMGLGQSDADIVRAIQNDPTFRGLDGKFEHERFVQTIRQAGYTEQRYIAEQRKAATRRQLTGTIVAGLEPPKTQIEALVRFQNEQRSADFVRLTAAQAGTIAQPSPETLATYFEDRKQLFRAPEYRKIAVLTLTPDDLAKWINVSDDDAKKIFEQRRERYATPERRQVLQIPFQNADEAKAARDRIAAGTSFEDIAKERKLTTADIDLGIVAKSSIGDSAIADAAFALAPDTVSEPVKAALITALLKVTKVEPGTNPTFESIAPAIKREIALERARAQLQDLHNKIEDERGGGANIAEAAQKLGLKATTIEAVDRSGRGPDGKPVTGLPQGVDIIAPAFASNIGVENEQVQYNGGELWFDVLGVTPSRDRSLDEVKDQVEARWRDEQISTRLRAKAAEMVGKLEKGAVFNAEAAAAGVKVETAKLFKRDAEAKDVPERLVAAAFRTPKDGIGQTEGSGASEWIVFKVTDVVVPPVDLASEDVKKLKENLQRAEMEEQLSAYIAKIESEIGVTINQNAFAVATGAASAQ